MREQRERRQERGWSFNAYFLLQEELAFMFEMLGLYDDALVQYDELDALFTQFILNHSAGGGWGSKTVYSASVHSLHCVLLLVRHSRVAQLVRRDGAAALGRHHTRAAHG